MRNLAALVIGAIFGSGILLSGMINPAKVLNFFDVAGTFDPSLAFVMAGALAVTIPGYALIFRRRSKPLIDMSFQLAKTRPIDKMLVGGAALFGIGWGIAGFCSGASIPALGLLDASAFIFVAALLVGMLIARALKKTAMFSPSKADSGRN